MNITSKQGRFIVRYNTIQNSGASKNHGDIIVKAHPGHVVISDNTIDSRNRVNIETAGGYVSIFNNTIVNNHLASDSARIAMMHCFLPGELMQDGCNVEIKHNTSTLLHAGERGGNIHVAQNAVDLRSKARVEMNSSMGPLSMPDSIKINVTGGGEANVITTMKTNISTSAIQLKAKKGSIIVKSTDGSLSGTDASNIPQDSVLTSGAVSFIFP